MQDKQNENSIANNVNTGKPSEPSARENNVCKKIDTTALSKPVDDSPKGLSESKEKKSCEQRKAHQPRKSRLAINFSGAATATQQHT